MRRAIATLLLLAAAGCASPNPATVPGGRVAAPGAATRTGSLTLAVAPAAYAIQAIARRWLASDIYQYEVTLQYWTGTSFADFEPAMTVVMPQKVEAPRQQARFSNLKQGTRYRAVLVVRGNPGGTAPTTVLNADATVAAIIDLTASQDVEEAQAVTLQGQLDAVPFAGAATVEVAGVPAGTTDLEAVLLDAVSGTALSTLSYPVTQQARFSGLRAGTTYQLALTASQDGSALATAHSDPFSWDPEAPSLASEQPVYITFPLTP